MTGRRRETFTLLPDAQLAVILAAAHPDLTPRIALVVSAVQGSSRSADRTALAALVARLVAAEDTASLAGAELVVGRGWAGLRAHPGPVASVAYAGAEPGPWLDDALREIG